MGKLLLVLSLPAFVIVCKAPKELEDPPIITSATYQHTLYTGRRQPIEAAAAKDTAPLVITYFRSVDDLWNNTGGTREVPREVGTYYARIERPAGKGYREGKPVKVEYYIQKAFVPIDAERRQVFAYDGTPKAALVHAPVALTLSYYDEAAPQRVLAGPPAERGRYRAAVSYPGDDRYMGASQEIELVIE
jgi:hypothetical protein